MKKKILILEMNSIKKVVSILFLFFSYISICSSQVYSVGIQTSTEGKHYYIGSLRKDSAIPHERLKVEIFGGSVHNSYLGIQALSISTRGGLKINREIHNGSVTNYDLNIFETNTGYDFTICIPKEVWSSICIQSYLLFPAFDGVLKQISPVNITPYDPIGKSNVTSNYTINTLLAINNTGDVGIGTASPQAKLDVRGKIIADQVEIKVNKGADFVFKHNYSLKSLSEVENFVKENQHLPDIPSEKDMQENGLNVNEMQIKLLQKIEELTLYIIQQNKKYNDLNSKYEVIKQEIKELREK